VVRKLSPVLDSDPECVRGVEPAPEQRCVAERLELENEIAHLRCLRTGNVIDDVVRSDALLAHEVGQLQCVSRVAPPRFSLVAVALRSSLRLDLVPALVSRTICDILQ